MVTRDYISLHAEYGGGAQGFRCQHCPRVVRTERGIGIHLLRVHGITLQGSLLLGGGLFNVTQEANAVEASHGASPQEVPAAQPGLPSR